MRRFTKSLVVSLCLILVSLSFTINVYGQVVVNGTVTSGSEDIPLPGATVVEKGTVNGTIADTDGKYSFSVSNENAILVYSFLGYLTVEQDLNGRSTVDIELEEDRMRLEQVVVTAYSQQSKTEISSSVVSLSASDVNQVTVNSVGDMLNGKVAGVSVQSASGNPGDSPDIRIRGVGSIFSTQEPLVVVDGVIGAPYNPNDIESISVLKDAGATGLYGSEAAAGVILIQTKKGIAGSSEINVKIRHGIKRPEFGKLQMMNSNELYDYQKTFYSPVVFQKVRPASLLETDYNWMDNSYKQSNITTAYVSATGSTEKLNYLLSADYMDDKGTLIGTDYERLSLKSKVDYQFNDRLKFTTNVIFNYDKGHESNWDISEAGYKLVPWDKPTDENGELVGDVFDAGWISNTTSNPMHNKENSLLGFDSFDAFANVGIYLNILDCLDFSSLTSLNAGFGKSYEVNSPQHNDYIAVGGSISSYNYFDKMIRNTSLLKFKKELGKHTINALAGVEYLGETSESIDGSGTDILEGKEVLSAAGTISSLSGNLYEHNKTSILSQLTYNYAGKYFATGSFRRDGDSKFSPNHKHGNFYAMSASWLLSNEDFMKQISRIHYLKPRVSYGATGNATFADDNYYPYFPSYAKFGTGSYNNEAPYAPVNAGNLNLTWETNYQLNFGLDIGLFNKVELNFDYYNSKSTDLLFQNPMPGSQGFTSQWANVGEISNKGFEMAINANIINTADFNWDLNFNIATNNNKLLALSDKESVDEIVLTRNEISQILVVGGGAFDWYMPKWLGVDPDNGNPLWEDIIYDDNTGEVIDRVETSSYADAAQDKQITGSPFPDFSGGFGSSLSYKGLSVNIAFAYSYGNEIYNYNRQELDNDGANPAVNAMKLIDGWSRWENPGDIATHPRPKQGGNLNAHQPSSRYLEDGSFLRLRNVAIAYDLPSKYTEFVKLNSVRLTVSMDNLKTWTNYSGTDPDVPLYTSGDVLPGQQIYKYPINKQFILGLQISF